MEAEQGCARMAVRINLPPRSKREKEEVLRFMHIPKMPTSNLGFRVKGVYIGMI